MQKFVQCVIDKNEKFSIIRCDVDLYKPTKSILKYLYNRLSIGGFIIFDEYYFDWCGEKYAVDIFRKEYNIDEKIIKVGQRIGFWQKKKEIY